MKNLLIFSFVALLSVFLTIGCSQSEQSTLPSYLKDLREKYAENPREANLKWFVEAKFGMFIHYGLYAQLAKGEWVQLRDTIPVAEYAKLKDTFTAENFDADFITDLAMKAGMKYITITSKHHDGFCLFRTQQTDFNSVDAPCGRDLIGELARACQEKGLALFLYYSYAADWKHPYFYPREAGWRSARPAYPEPQPEYKFEKDEDFRIYVDYVHEHLKELLNQYPTIAGIWFDPIMGFYSRPDLFPIEETYALVRSLSPHALISFKQGANGDEDFMAPERHGGARVGSQFEVANRVYELNKEKPREICTTLQPRAWGYNESVDGQHATADDVMDMLQDADEMNANLLLNIGPKADGSIPEEDVVTLTEVGKRLR
jgi:alpha-L-fucosidase